MVLVSTSNSKSVSVVNGAGSQRWNLPTASKTKQVCSRESASPPAHLIVQQWHDRAGYAAVQGHSTPPSWCLGAGDLQCSHCKSLHSSAACTISMWQRARALIGTSIQSLMIFRAQAKSSDGAAALTCPHIPDLDVLWSWRRKCTKKKQHCGGKRFDSVSCRGDKSWSSSPGRTD